MRRPALWLICALLLTASGCADRGQKAPETTPTPEVTAPAETPSPEPTAEPTPEPTPSPTPTPEPATPPVYRWTRSGEAEPYTLLIGTGEGAAALGKWLRTEGATLAAAYEAEGTGEAMFTLLFTPQESGEAIPAATEETKLVRLATDERILRSGLLSALLPVFERGYGYTVEVSTGDAAEVQSWAGSAAADVTLLTDADAAVLGQRGFVTVGAYFSTVYTLAK